MDNPKQHIPEKFKRCCDCFKLLVDKRTIRCIDCYKLSLKKRMIGNSLRKGIKWSEEHKNLISEKLKIVSHRGKANHRFGKKLSTEMKSRISLKLKGTRANEKHPRWKGDNVGYSQLHIWIRKNKVKSKFCECCKLVPPKDLANISQKYHRDINDFEWLCRKCHQIKDDVQEKRKKTIKIKMGKRVNNE